MQTRRPILQVVSKCSRHGSFSDRFLKILVDYLLVETNEHLTVSVETTFLSESHANLKTLLWIILVDFPTDCVVERLTKSAQSKILPAPSLKAFRCNQACQASPVADNDGATARHGFHRR